MIAPILIFGDFCTIFTINYYIYTKRKKRKKNVLSRLKLRLLLAKKAVLTREKLNTMFFVVLQKASSKRLLR